MNSAPGMYGTVIIGEEITKLQGMLLAAVSLATGALLAIGSPLRLQWAAGVGDCHLH